MRSRRRFVAVLASLGLFVSACGGDEPRTTSSSEATTPTTTTTGDAASSCTPPRGRVPREASDLGNDRDWDIVSFDGTVIRALWFPVADASADSPAPTVLMGPGWGSAGDVDVEGDGTAGTVSIGMLLDAGYNVLTWDPRGFGESGGEAQIDSPEFEGRDIQQLIDFVGSRSEAQLDVAGDPRLGMVGASYGGGAQFIAAGTDCRVDAIVPIIAWNSLDTSLFKGGVPKLGWANFLLLAAQFGGGTLDPTITRAAATANSTGTFTDADAQWFIERGPADVVDDIGVPTLIIQGTVDGLFTLDEAVANYTTLRTAGTEVAMLWYCGGHGICLTDEGDTELVAASALAWLDRHVRGDSTAAPVAGFAAVDQFGTVHTAVEWPAADTTPLVASGSGTLDLVETGGSGPATASGAGGFDITAGVILAITPGRATNAVEVVVPAPEAEAFVVGAPMLSLTYSGTVPAGDRPTAVFAQLVDDSTGIVLGNQVTPVPLVLDGTEHTLDIPLETVAHLLRPGSSLTLQLVATTVAYAQPQLGGSVTFSAISITLPVTTALRPAT
jgi:ABC-2 type transport system ATP-binding protein